MTYFNQIASDVSGSVHAFFSQVLQKTSEWSGYVVRYIQHIPQTLAQHPNAAIATLVTVNFAAVCILEKAFNRIKPGATDEKLLSTQALLRNAAVLSLSIGLNLGLFRVTKLDVDAIGIAIISLTNVIFRQMLVRFSNIKAVPQLSSKEGASLHSETKKTLEDSHLEEGSTISAFAQDSLEEKKIFAKQAEEVAKKFKSLEQEAGAVAKIAALDIEVIQLKADKNALNAQLKNEQDNASKAFDNLKDDMNVQLKASAAIIDNLTTTLNKTEAQRIQLEATLTLKDGDLSSANQSNVDLKKDFDNLKQQRDQLNNQLTALQTTHQALTQNFDALRDEKEGLEAGRDAALLDQESLNDYVDDLKGQLEKKDNIIAGLRAAKNANDSKDTTTTGDTDQPATPQVRGLTPKKDRQKAIAARFAAQAQSARKANNGKAPLTATTNGTASGPVDTH